jgi:SAM-dependent methyltransferase
VYSSLRARPAAEDVADIRRDSAGQLDSGPAPIARGLACPYCGGELHALQCSACGGVIPAFDGIPWLFPDPVAARMEWRNRYAHAQRRLEAERERATAARATVASVATLRRLDRLIEGQTACLAELGTLLGASLGLDDAAALAPLESHVALRTRLPPGQGLLTYETNVFRDWCWGDAENAAALDEVRSVLRGVAPSRVLVLGAGAGRLAYDLHGVLPGAVTIALDLNPLLACVGARVSRGDTLELTEFPLAPRRPEDVALSRRLAAPRPARPGLSFVLGDALAPPFVAGAFDLVVTPWLLDILEAPPQVLMAHVNRLLAPGGTWVYHGSVAFAHPDPALQFTGEELVAAAAESGFVVGVERETELSYLRCPESRHGRVERVLTFRADRRSACAVVPRMSAVPEWLADPSQPVPALPAFRSQALATRTHAYIMSLIDGRRSLGDIARVLAQHGLMDEDGARVALAGFFTTMYEEASRARML